MEEVKEVPAIRRGGKYEWDEIFDGTLWKLRGGEKVSKAERDFDCGALSFAQNARSAAKRLGVKLEVCSVRGIVRGDNGKADYSKAEVYIQSVKLKK